LLRQKREKAESHWLKSLQDNIEPIKINQSVLSAIKPPQSTKSIQRNPKPPELPKG